MWEMSDSEEGEQCQKKLQGERKNNDQCRSKATTSRPIQSDNSDCAHQATRTTKPTLMSIEGMSHLTGVRSLKAYNLIAMSQKGKLYAKGLCP
jgi:hypothetical protein